MYFAFLDHLSNELELTFPGDQRQILLGQYLMHSKFDNLVNELSTVFRADLSDLAILLDNQMDNEILWWVWKYPYLSSNLLSYAREDFYTNIRQSSLFCWHSP